LKPYYRRSPIENEFLEEEISKLLEDGIISPSESPWSAPVVIVKKKNGKLRLCVDYRQLNAVTIRDQYPLPRIDELLDSFKDCHYFSTIDLASGFWQVEMKPEDKPKTAFITKQGLFEFNVMPFGLTNAPATFQRLMNTVFREYIDKFIVVYIDDTTIYSKTFEEHLIHLRMTFDKLRQAGLKVQPDKCHFGKTSLPFLGYIIGKDGIKPDPAKVEKVQNFPAPTNLTELRGFVGLASYYRRFIINFAKIASPLHKLFHKDQPYNWTSKQQAAFEELKKHLTTAPILTYPDFTKPFILFTDASTLGLGAVLSQKDNEGKERVIAYASRRVSNAEANYSITELECLAVVWAIKLFRPYLQSHIPFELITDHSALKWLVHKPNPPGRLARWIMTLRDYNFTVTHKKGKTHSNVDPLSRIPHTSDNSSIT